MRNSTIYGHKRSRGRSTKHIVVEPERHARLRCGHEVTGVPVITGPGSRRYFHCPEGCGIQRAR